MIKIYLLYMFGKRTILNDGFLLVYTLIYVYMAPANRYLYLEKCVFNFSNPNDNCAGQTADEWYFETVTTVRLPVASPRCSLQATARWFFVHSAVACVGLS